MTQGILFALLAALISGLSIFYNKLVIVKGIDPLIFNIIKNGGVALLLTFLLLRPKTMTQVKQLTLPQWMKLWLIALVGGSIPFVLFFTGLREISALNANLIQKSLFVWVAALAVPLLGEKLTVKQVIGYVIVIISNVLIGGFSGFTGSRGELMIFAATLLWSLEIVIAKTTLRHLENTIVGWGRMFLGTLILLGIAVFQHKMGLFATISAQTILMTASSIFLLFGYVLSWYAALKHAPATVATAVLILATPITNVLTVVFINHSIVSLPWVNFLMILGIFSIAAFAKPTQNENALTIEPNHP